MAIPKVEYRPPRKVSPPPPESERRPELVEGRLKSLKAKAQEILRRKGRGPQPEPGVSPVLPPGEPGMERLAQMQRNIAEANIQRAAQASGIPAEALRAGQPISSPFAEVGKGLARQVLTSTPAQAFLPFLKEPGYIETPLPKGKSWETMTFAEQEDWRRRSAQVQERMRQPGLGERLAERLEPITRAGGIAQMVGALPAAAFGFVPELAPQEMEAMARSPLTAAIFAPGPSVAGRLPLAFEQLVSGLGTAARGARPLVATQFARSAAEARAMPGALEAGFARIPKGKVPAPAPVAKEPWQMTPEELKPLVDAGRVEGWQTTRSQNLEFSRAKGIGVEGLDRIAKMHRGAVEKAVSQGKPVPVEVLKDYPDLAKVAKAPVVETRNLTTALEAKGLHGTADKWNRNLITEAQARAELAGGAPIVEAARPLNPADVAAEMKGAGIGRQESWSRWVQRTSLRPGMDAKDWYKIYDSVSPSPRVGGQQAAKIPVAGVETVGQFPVAPQPLAKELPPVTKPAAPARAAAPPPEAVAPRATEVRPAPPAPVAEGVTPPPPTKPPVPPTGEIPPVEPLLPRPRTLADMNREAKGMRAMTPEQRAAVMDVAKPIEGDIIYQARPFNEHAQNLLGPDTPFMRTLRSVPGVKQLFGVWNPAAMARDNPIAMIGLRQGIFQEIEKARVRFASLRWWHEAEEAFKFQRSGTLYGLKPTSGVWKATKVKPASTSVQRGKMFGTINDIIEHPERYALDDAQKKVLALADNTLTQSVRDAQRAGVNVVELAEAYWPRSVIKGPKGEKGFAGIRRRVSGAKGYTHQRVFADVDDLVKAGFDVEADPRRVFASRLEAGIDTIAQANARKQIAALPGVEKPLERMVRRFPEALESAGQARIARDAAKVIVVKAGAKATPEQVMALRQAEANYITSMREVFAKKIEAGTPGYYELRLPSGRIAPQELVEQVGKLIDLPELRQETMGGAARLTQEVSQLLRTSLTNVDLAAGYIQGQALFYRNNIAWWKAQGHSVVSLIDDPAAWVAKNYELIDEGVRAGAIVAPTEFLFAKQGIASIPLRIPYVGPGLGSFNRAFEWFITAGQTELYKAARSGAFKAAGMDDLVSLGSAIRKQVGTESYAILGIRSNQRTMEALSLFAARFFRANIGLLGQSFTRGPGGVEARKAVGSLIGGGTALLVGINWAQNKKLPNMTDPYAPDWMQFKIGETYFNTFGPFYPYFRTIARMSVALGEGDPMKAATQVRQFLQSKESLPLRGIDIAGQLVYYGSASVYGTKIEKNWLSIAKGILSEFVTPISVQEIPSGIAEGRPESALEFIGLVGRPARLASEWYKELQPYYDIPGDKELRIMREEILEKGLSKTKEEAELNALAKKYPLTREQDRGKNPEVDAQLFILGRVDSLKSNEAFDAVKRLMEENNLTIKDVMPVEKGESDARKKLRQNLEKALGVSTPKVTPTPVKATPSPSPRPTISPEELERIRAKYERLKASRTPVPAGAR